MKRVLIVLTVMIAIGMVVFITDVLQACRDIPPPDVSDLAVDRPEVSPEDNAYTYFLSATEALYWPEDMGVVTDYLEGQHVDPETLERIIAKNERTLALIRRGVECERCLPPGLTWEPVNYHLKHYRNMASVLAAQVRMDRLAGRHANAADTCITLLRLADLIQQDAESFFDYLLATNLLDLGLAQAQDLAREPGTPVSVLQRLSSDLAGLGPVAPGFIRGIKGEYQGVAAHIDQSWDGLFAREDSPASAKKRVFPYSFHRNRTKLAFANFYRGMISDASLPYSKARRDHFDEAFRLSPNRLVQAVYPNVMGKQLYAIALPSSTRTLEVMCKAECGIEATRILTAMALHREEHGNAPDTLSVLVPGYLSAVPLDPFDGQPFRYVPEMGIIYSIGPGLDDSGRSGSEPAGIVFKIDEWWAQDPT